MISEISRLLNLCRFSVNVCRFCNICMRTTHQSCIETSSRATFWFSSETRIIFTWNLKILACRKIMTIYQPFVAFGIILPRKFIKTNNTWTMVNKEKWVISQLSTFDFLKWWCMNCYVRFRITKRVTQSSRFFDAKNSLTILKKIAKKNFMN